MNMMHVTPGTGPAHREHVVHVCEDPHPVSLSRCGFCYAELEHVPAGLYNVIPTTFLPKQEGPFFLDLGSTLPLKVSQLQ